MAIGKIGFQSLIGILQTVGEGETKPQTSMFQSLIGILQTNKPSCLDCLSEVRFNPS